MYHIFQLKFCPLQAYFTKRGVPPLDKKWRDDEKRIINGENGEKRNKMANLSKNAIKWRI